MTDIFLDRQQGDIQLLGNEVATVSGIANYKQQLELRFLTERGEIFHYPDYGTTLYQYAGKALSQSRQDEIRREIVATCSQDPRTERIESVQSVLAEGRLTVTATITALGQTVLLQVVVGGDDVEVSVT